jgi:3-oxoacyl-[acyl-carrier protein] reductase
MSSVVGVKEMLDKRIMLLQKRALLVFKSVALELGSRNIRCNVIAPGFIETEMTAKLNEDVVKDGEFH